MTKRKNLKLSPEVYDVLSGWIERERERVGFPVTINQAIARLVELSEQVSPTCLPGDSHLSPTCLPPGSHGDSQVTPTRETPVSHLSPTDRLQSRVPTRGRDSRAPVPASSIPREELEKNYSLDVPSSSVRGTGRTRGVVTVEWLAARWNRWCDARTVAGSFEPRKIDLVGERPSRRYCAKVVKAFTKERADNPAFDGWSAALDALDALPEYAGQRLWGWSDTKTNKPGLAELFGAPSNDTTATKQARLWHIGDGRWATWTGPSGPSGPPRQVATVPRHHTYESRGEDEMAPPVWEWTAGKTREEVDEIFCAWLDECERLGKDPTTRTLPENVARRSPLRPDQEWKGAVRLADAY